MALDIVSDNIYNSSEFSEEELAEINLPSDAEEKPEFTRIECIISVLVALISFGFIRFVVLNTTGFITTLLYLVIITTVIIYLKLKKFNISKVNKLIAVTLYLFSFTYSLTANDFIKTLNTVFLFFSGAYFIYSVTANKDSIERFLPFAIIKSIFEYPFSKFSTQFAITKEVTKQSKFGTNLKMIILGLLLTIPLTVTVAALLMSADDGLSEMLGNLANSIFSDSLATFIAELMLTIPCSAYLFGMIYSNTHRKDLNILEDENCEEIVSKAKCIQNVIVYTAVTPIFILYIMFFISQANYFLSAFAGSLPSGYSYADYARQGFFELVAITVINLAVIIFMNLFSKNGNDKKPITLRIYSITLSIFTIILIATAISKMVMYISEYGLTQLRVYTTWFMLLCAVIFIMIIIKQIKVSFRFAQKCTAAFTIMFAILCFTRPDALIAKYNIEMYNSGILNELDKSELLHMSDDAILEALNSEAVSIDDIVKIKGKEYTDNSYRKFNISSLLVSNYIDAAQ